MSQESPVALLEKPRIVEGKRVVFDVRRHNDPAPYPIEVVLTDGQWCLL